MSVQVYAGGVLAYDDRLPAEKNYTLLSGLVSESLNKGGTATIVLPPGHPASGAFPALVVPVEIYKNGRLRWRGRPLPNVSDIYGRRTVTCEGELCFLNDVVSRPYSYSGDPAELFAAVLEAYNAGADSWKRFVVGAISVTGEAMELSSADPEKALVTVQKLIKTYGGYILFDSAPDGSRRINWYSQLPYSCNQKIRYGHNLTDFNSQADLTGFATRIVPYGATDADGNRIKIDNDGKDYVENAEAVAARGVIEKPVIYDDISDPDELKARAEQDVQSSGTLPAVLRLSAVDMSRLNLQLDGFRIGQRVEAESGPHGMSGLYDLVSLTEDIVNPTVGQATLTRDAAYIDLASGTMTGALNKQLQAEKDEYKKAFSSYLGAVASLTSTILGAKGGAVRILDTDGDGLNDTLYVADNPDPELAKKVWRFNYEGWAGSQTGYNGPFIMGATLKDGLLAAAVTAAHLVAGTIISPDGKTIYLDLDNGIFKADFTELSIAGKSVDTIAQDKIDAQTQTEIFNKLTNNGALQGFYIQNGKLYINAEFVSILNLIANHVKSISGSNTMEIVGSALSMSYDGTVSVQLHNGATSAGQVWPIMYLIDMVKNSAGGYDVSDWGELSPHHIRLGGQRNYPKFEVMVSNDVSKMSVDVINKGKTALFTGSCAKDASCTVPNTANYDLFAIYLGDGTTAEITPVLCYKNGNNIRGCGARAGTTTEYKELHFFEATISGNTWTVSDAGKHSVYMSGGISDGTRLKLMKVVGVI